MQQEAPACLQLALGPCQKALTCLQKCMPKETLAHTQVIMHGEGNTGMCHTARRPPRVAPTAEEVPTPTRPLEFSAEAGWYAFQQDRTQDRFTTTMSLDRFTTTMSITPACRPAHLPATLALQLVAHERYNLPLLTHGHRIPVHGFGSLGRAVRALHHSMLLASPASMYVSMASAGLGEYGFQGLQKASTRATRSITIQHNGRTTSGRRRRRR